VVNTNIEELLALNKKQDDKEALVNGNEIVLGIGRTPQFEYLDSSSDGKKS